MGPNCAPDFEKIKMDLFKKRTFMLAIFAPLHDYDVLISNFPCFPLCFCACIIPYNFEVLPQDISSNRTPSIEIMSYRDSTFVPKGHQTYEEIKDSSEKCQHEKGDCLTKEFVSRLL